MVVLSMLKDGISISYICYNLKLRRGKKCPDRKNGDKCMHCQYCKAQLPADDATRLLRVFSEHRKCLLQNNEKI